MTSSPRISVLLPTHNRADVLPFAIESVLAQSEQDFELLIVGDGCTDDTAAVVARYEDPRIRWFDLPKGPGFGYANRNVALREARGAYVGFMAHDDLWFTDHVAQLITLIEATDVELAYSLPTWVIPRGLVAPLSFNLHDAERRAWFLAGHNMIPAACVVHRRECLDRYGYWDDTRAESADHEMWCRIITGRPGHGNLAYLREATTLHFRANWRNANTTEPLLTLWHRLLMQPGLMPDGLRLDAPAECTEQQSVWDAMAKNPTTWVRDLRIAIGIALDRRVAADATLWFELLKLCETRGASEYFGRALADPHELIGAIEDGRLSRSAHVVGWLRDTVTTLRR